MARDDDYSRLDFIFGNRITIDMSNSRFALAYSSFMYAYIIRDRANRGIEDFFGWSFIICIVMSLLFITGIFVTRVSEYRSLAYIKIMPEAAFYMVLISSTVMPLLNVVLNCLAFFSSNKENRPEITPLLTF